MSLTSGPSGCPSNALPSFPLLVRLLGFAHRFPSSHIAIKDLSTGFLASHIQLLNDALALRDAIYDTLSPPARQILASNGELPLILLAGPGYEYVVGFLAILSLGAIIVPVSPHCPLEEALYFAEKSSSHGIISVSSMAKTTTAVQNYLRKSGAPSYFVADITKALGKRSLRPHEIQIQRGRSLSSDEPGLVIFTSGTTGRPKAVVLPREILVSGVQALADHFQITPDDVSLNCMPVHHIAGIAVCFVPFLFGGARIEFDSFNVQRVWDRWRQGGISVFGGVPTMYARLMRHYEDNIRGSLAEKQYVAGMRSLRFMMSGTSTFAMPLRKKWADLSGGMSILERYGASEYGVALLTSLGEGKKLPPGTCGRPLTGCDVKLAAQPVGEILVKVPGMLLRYHRDPEATKAAFTPDGYFKTGDIGRREGDFWFVMGRESVDIIKSGGYKISALDIEREILGLDYISEAAVVGVADEEFGQRVAAVVVLRNRESLAISALRNALRSSLSGYKLPTLLMVVDEIPKTISGKIQKAALRKQIFESGKFDAAIQRFVPKSTGPVVAVQAKL